MNPANNTVSIMKTKMPGLFMEMPPSPALTIENKADIIVYIIHDIFLPDKSGFQY